MIAACLAGFVSPVVAEPENHPIANVLVWVRDGRGAPVTNLTAGDFAVTENGLSDRVTGVKSFFAGEQNRALTAAGADQQRGKNAMDPGTALTHILVLMEPMAAGPRNYAVRDALRFFSTSPAGNWRVALVDDVGNFVSYSPGTDQIRSTLKRLEDHYTPHAQGAWTVTVQSAVRELGTLPGRHVILLISTHDSAYSSMLVGLAITAQAAMYTIDSAGPTSIVPFGGAAEFQSTEAGPIPFVTGEFAPLELASTLSALGYTNTGIGWSRHAAEETGGLSVGGVKDAFEHIAADAAGYYLVSFEARAQESGGTFSPFSIAVNRPHVDVKGPRYYIIPPEGASAQMPAEMIAALQSPGSENGIGVVANSWLFPSQGSVHWGVFAAELSWLDGAPRTGSTVKVFAELINGSMHGLSATWLEEKVWSTPRPVIHWQKEGMIYPGAYTLRVTAMDTASGKVAIGSSTFMARPLDMPAFRFSSIVLSDACLPATEQFSGRQNLLDPLLWNGCKMAPPANAQFKSDQMVRILLRIYPPGEKVSRLVLEQWKAYAVVDDMLEKATELQLSAGEVRGMSITGTLPLNRLNLMAGEHRLTVLFVMPGEHSQTHKIPLQTGFRIAQ